MSAITRSQPNTAFSLVELSIVLVILGLLVGGVLSGQSLIHAAELRSVTSDFAKYKATVHTFRDKYFALPGDMTNATAFWGGISGVNTTCASTPTNSSTSNMLTCNGDGDGFISLASGLPTIEEWAFWRHLANAGLIEGAYTGANSQPNSPVSRLDGAVWSALAGGNYWSSAGSTPTAGSGNYFAGSYGNVLSLNHINSGGAATPGILSPEDTWNIDTKLDDGKPGTGAMIVFKVGITGSQCTTTDGVAPPGDTTSQYALSDTGKSCNPMFLRAF